MPSKANEPLQGTRSGITFAEVIVVGVIASMLFLVIYRYYSFGVRVSRKGTAHLEIIRSASSILRNMQSDLQKYCTVDTSGQQLEIDSSQDGFFDPQVLLGAALPQTLTLSSSTVAVSYSFNQANGGVLTRTLSENNVQKESKDFADAMITNFEALKVFYNQKIYSYSLPLRTEFLLVKFHLQVDDPQFPVASMSFSTFLPLGKTSISEIWNTYPDGEYPGRNTPITTP